MYVLFIILYISIIYNNIYIYISATVRLRTSGVSLRLCGSVLCSLLFFVGIVLLGGHTFRPACPASPLSRVGFASYGGSKSQPLQS